MNGQKCHFCGYRYTEEELRDKCGSCPLASLHAGCGASCCPNCGIELRMKSSIVEMVERVAARLKTGRG